jgi:hypothetical protein
MTGRTTAVWLGVAIALVFANPLHAQDVWKGPVKQNIGTSDYTVVMTLSGSGGTTDYPELKCGGTLTRVNQSGAYSFYLEKITRKGAGCANGAITTIASGNMMGWGWVGVDNGKTFVGWSYLTKQ